MFMLLSINNSNFKVKIVVSEKEVQNGMMGRKFDKNFNGMLFIMDGNEHCFWMKNCVTDLDIIFIKDDKITKIHHNCPPCLEEDCINYCGKGNIVLELQGGTCKRKNINVGDKIEY